MLLHHPPFPHFRDYKSPPSASPSSTPRLHYSLSLPSLCENPKELAQVHSLFLKSSVLTTSFAYNSLIRSYTTSGDPRSALILFCELHLNPDVHPDRFTLTFVLNACARCSTFVRFGKQVHALMAKSQFEFPTQTWNSLMSFYLKSGADAAHLSWILNGMKNPDVVSWNCLLDGYVKMGDLISAKRLFDKMPYRNVVSWTTMLTMFANAGLIDETRRWFEQMPQRNMVSWSTMIGACIRAGNYSEALTLFREMLDIGVGLDEITLTTLLSACARLGALEQGRWIHAQIDKRKLKFDCHLCTSLVDMYAKCGEIDRAYDIFRGFHDKKVFLWNAMLGGLAMHSRGKEVILLFSKLCDSGIKPNEITFICVLSACSHSGLVDDGLHIFSAMEKDYGIKPTIVHYRCIVDLLGRAGLIDEAKKLVEEMPISADGDIWRALVGACKLHGKTDIGVEVEKILLDLDPFDDGNYVLLSNLYARDSRWKDVARVRRKMKDKGLQKLPGCSSIEVHGSIHEFIAGDLSHPSNVEIYSLLNKLSEHILMSDEGMNHNISQHQADMAWYM
ncbi:hypothetical protein HPP92_016357 [Vanilla planifolia]|uniref:Uncharacterized protein n=1 Tax=Vanilla planifolia TaxID=51239 RepID=A0A835QJ08_VANPL|nr:hypothetical protein HPP92_016357 [Vanilla planifolia]